MGQQITIPDPGHTNVDQRMNLERCLSQVDFEKWLVTLKHKYKLLNGMTKGRWGGQVLHASKRLLDSQYTSIMETELKEK